MVQVLVEAVPAGDNDWRQMGSAVCVVQRRKDEFDRVHPTVGILGDLVEPVKDGQDSASLHQLGGDPRQQMISLGQPVNQPVVQRLLACPPGHAYRHRHLRRPLIPATEALLKEAARLAQLPAAFSLSPPILR